MIADMDVDQKNKIVNHKGHEGTRREIAVIAGIAGIAVIADIGKAKTSPLMTLIGNRVIR